MLFMDVAAGVRTGRVSTSLPQVYPYQQVCHPLDAGQSVGWLKMGARNERLRWQLISGVLRALPLERLFSRSSRQTVMAGCSLINGGLSIALVAFVALVTQEAFIFPSLGATAFILFHVPMAEPASLCNTLCGHFLGATMGLTGCLMVLFRVPHPPAGATALIVSLGLMPDPAQLPVLMAGVLMLLAHAFVMNRLSGIPYPLWRTGPTAVPSEASKRVPAP